MLMDFMERTREQLILLFFAFFIVLFTMKNGNILTDGRNEREYLKRKYNELQIF